MKSLEKKKFQNEERQENDEVRRLSEQSGVNATSPANIFKYRHAFFHQTNGSNSITFREYDIKSGCFINIAKSSEKEKKQSSMQ